MALADVPVLLMLGGLTAYVVLGGADFGAGLWYMTLGGERHRALRDHTYRAMGPVWEANHVWLIFVLVVAWTAYPTAFASIASTLYVPLFVAALGIILRGTAYALRGSATGVLEERLLGAVFGASSVLTPLALGAAVGGIASGRVPVGNAAGDPVTAWLNPTSAVVGSLAVATSAYLAAVWLTADAARAGRGEITRAFQGRALSTGMLAGVLALVGLPVLDADAPEISSDLLSDTGLAALAASAAAGVATLVLVRRGRFEAARYGSAVAVAAIVAGWALAQRPDLLPGLTVSDAAASDEVLGALLVCLGLGTLVLAPSLALLFRLVLTGRFDEAPRPELRDQVPDAKPSRHRGLIGPAGALTAVAGAVMTMAADGGAVQAVGVVALLAGAATASAWIVGDVTREARLR